MATNLCQIHLYVATESDSDIMMILGVQKWIQNGKWLLETTLHVVHITDEQNKAKCSAVYALLSISVIQFLMTRSLKNMCYMMTAAFGSFLSLLQCVRFVPTKQK